MTALSTTPAINLLAERYVKLSLQIGQHCPYYVDAYYGPKAWNPQSEAVALNVLLERTQALVDAIEALPDQTCSALKHRVKFLLIQVKSSRVYINRLQGNLLNFDDECAQLYDVKVPHYDTDHFELILKELELLIPGQGVLAERLTKYRERFVVPTEKLTQVFDAAIGESRRRTLKHIDLPAHESFKVELTNNQIWSAYNWYKGNSYSLIELNTDFPIQIERVIDLAAHEGYPGHHVFNAQIERHLVNELGWMEYSIYNLYSPISLLAEGSANYGIEVAFPWQERLDFERQTLFPLAGLNPDDVSQYYAIQKVLHRLSYADNMVAKQFLDGEINEQQAIDLLIKYALSNPERAKQRLAFIKHNRAYVVTYNYGQDLVEQYLSTQVSNDSHQELWRVFGELLATPLMASMMKSA